MQSIGKKGEDKASAFLSDAGYKILERNYRFKRSEIDLICQHEGIMVFVEVKLRSSNAYGEPESFVTDNQQSSIIRAAEHFMDDTQWHGEIRFDVISILEKGDRIEIVHFKDAFY